MTNEEAISILDEMKHEKVPKAAISIHRQNEALKMAILALYQVCKDVGKHVEFGGDYCDAGLIIDSAECPTCGYYYDLGDPGWGEPFCPHCGQKLLWEEITNDE